MVELRLLDPDAARSAHRHHCRWLDDLSFDDLPGSISPLIPHVGGVTRVPTLAHVSLRGIIDHMQDDIPYISDDLFAQIVTAMRKYGGDDNDIAYLFPDGARSVALADWTMLQARARERIKTLLASEEAIHVT
jgi:hypothetical protein